MKTRILLLALFVPLSSAFGQSVALSIGSGSGSAGSVVSLPVGISSSGGAQPQAVQWTFSISPAGAVTSYTTTDGSSATSVGKSVSCGDTCLVAGLNSNIIPNGTLATVNFQLSPSASGAITVTLASPIASDGVNPINPTTGGSGSISVLPPPASLSSLSCSPNSFSAAGTSTCTVTLTSTAGATVSLSDNSANVTTPASVIVSSGQLTAQFTATVTGVPGNETATITAGLNGGTQTANLALTSLPVLSSVTCQASSLSSNQSTTCTATINKLSVGTTTVTLTDNTNQLTTPASVAIANNQTSNTFTVSSGTVTVNESATVTGFLNGLPASAHISMVPPVSLSGLSCSPSNFSAAGTSTCTVTLSATASSNTAVTLSDNSANVTTPANVTVLNGQSNAQFTAAVTGVPADETATITASLNGTRTANLVLTTLPALSSVSCTAGSLNSNQSTTCTANLSKAAVGATLVALTDNSGQLTTPANVTIANGQTSGQFTVTAGTITAGVTATVTGTLNGVNQSDQINLVAPAGLSGLSCSPSNFSAAGTSICTVALVAAATSNTVVTLSDNSANVTTPANATVLSGQSSAQFTATVTGVPADETAAITASLNGGTQSANLTLTTLPVLTNVTCVSGSLNSNQSTTCTAVLNKPSAGTTFVTLSDDSGQLTTPANVGIPNGQSNNTFTVTAGAIATSETATIQGFVNNSYQYAHINLISPAGLSGLSCTPSNFSAAGASTCTVTLVSAAASNTVVALSDNSANVTTPANVTVSSGQSSAQFTASVTGVPADETATITASLNGGTQSASLSLATAPVLTSVTCANGSLSSNQPKTCSVNLNKAALSSTVVALSDNSSQLTVPANATIGIGQTSAQFSVTAGTITTSETVTVSGALNGLVQSAQIALVAPAGLSGLSCNPSTFTAAGAATCTVSLAAAPASNTVVALSDVSANVTTPANVTVVAGQATAQFTATVTGVPADETVTITASLNGGTQTASLILSASPVLTSVACPTGSLASNQSMVCSVNLSKGALSPTVVTLSDNSNQLTTPANATISTGQSSATFTIAAGPITSSQTATVTGAWNGLLQSAQVSLVAASGLSGLSCSPNSFSAAGNTICTVTLASAASGNVVVTLLDDNDNVTTPATVTVPSGQSSIQFTSNVTSVPGDATVTITAALDSGSLTTELTLSSSPVLSSITCTATALVSNQGSNCAATLSKPAVDATVVTLTDSSNQLATPTSVIIPIGQTSGQFTINAGAIISNEAVTITGTLNGITSSIQISLAAPASNGQTSVSLTCSANTLAAGQSILCDVTLSVPITFPTVLGLSTTSDSIAIPASVSIPAGQTTAQFRISGPANLSDGTMQVTASSGSSTASFTITLKGGGSPDLILLSCAPSSLAAGESTLCTATLSRGALNDTIVTISGGNNVVTLPAQVTIPLGSATATFTAKVGNISSAQIVTLYASSAGKQVAAALNLTGPAVQPGLQSFNCTPATVPAGTSSFCTVTFTGRIVFPANLGIAATGNLLQVPAQLAPAVGVSSISFVIQAGATDTEQSVVIGLTWSGSAPQSQTIRVTPQASVALDAPSAVFTRAGQPVAFDVKLVRSSSFGAQVTANPLPNGATFQNMHFAWAPSTDDIGEHLIEVRATDNSNGVAVSSFVRVVVRAAQASIDTLVNPAGFTVSGQCSANSLMTLLGRGFSLHDPDHASTVPLPTTLGGVRVRINDIYAPLLHVQDDLIHFECPQLAPATDLQIVLEYEAAPPPPNGPAPSGNTLTVAPLHATMSTASPGIYIVGGTQGAVIGNVSGLIAGDPASEYPAQPAAPGDYLVIYGNGMGSGTSPVAPGDASPLNPLVYSTATVTVDFGNGIKVPASFAGLAPGFIGLFQVNVQIPSGTQFGMAVPITLEMAWPAQTLRSNTVTVAIQPR